MVHGHNQGHPTFGPEGRRRRPEELDEETMLKARMSQIKHKIAVISGKGGVGKSTVTANLAFCFVQRGHRVGVLDADIHGPCIPKMLGARGKQIAVGPAGAMPVTSPSGVKVVSMDFLLSSDETPVIWRGPLKMGAIRQFLSEFEWGALDFLLIDLPPGTGDEPLTVAQLVPDMDGAVIVTIPSEASQMVVRKAVTFARELKIPVLGIIENMSGFTCPYCGNRVEIFRRGGGLRIAEELSVPFLGSIPLDPAICNASDEGVSFVLGDSNSPAAKIFAQIVDEIEKLTGESPPAAGTLSKGGE